ARGLGQGAANLGVRDGQIFIARIRPWREDDARRDTRAMPCEELPPIAPCDRWPADGVRTGLLIPAYHRRTVGDDAELCMHVPGATMDRGDLGVLPLVVDRKSELRDVPEERQIGRPSRPHVSAVP